eukprot:Awhi_evm1s7519
MFSSYPATETAMVLLAALSFSHLIWSVNSVPLSSSLLTTRDSKLNFASLNVFTNDEECLGERSSYYNNSKGENYCHQNEDDSTFPGFQVLCNANENGIIVKMCQPDCNAPSTEILNALNGLKGFDENGCFLVEILSSTACDSKAIDENGIEDGALALEAASLADAASFYRFLKNLNAYTFTADCAPAPSESKPSEVATLNVYSKGVCSGPDAIYYVSYDNSIREGHCIQGKRSEEENFPGIQVTCSSTENMLKENSVLVKACLPHCENPALAVRNALSNSPLFDNHGCINVNIPKNQCVENPISDAEFQTAMLSLSSARDSAMVSGLNETIDSIISFYNDVDKIFKSYSFIGLCEAETSIPLQKITIDITYNVPNYSNLEQSEKDEIQSAVKKSVIDSGIEESSIKEIIITENTSRRRRRSLNRRESNSINVKVVFLDNYSGEKLKSVVEEVEKTVIQAGDQTYEAQDVETANEIIEDKDDNSGNNNPGNTASFSSISYYVATFALTIAFL